MDKLGKLTFKKLTSDDVPQIEKFCKKCALLGYENNSSLKAMKFDFATFFGAYDQDKIVSLAGVHHIPELGSNAWRCLFRGAQLPGYTPKWSMNIFNSGIHFSQFLFQQINFIKESNALAEFYITTNVNNPKAGASSRLHKTMMPRLSKMGYWNLVSLNTVLYNTEQSVWKVNVFNYMKDRELWLSSYSCTG
jgi:hypothetical protein